MRGAKWIWEIERERGRGRDSLKIYNANALYVYIKGKASGKNNVECPARIELCAVLRRIARTRSVRCNINTHIHHTHTHAHINTLYTRAHRVSLYFVKLR